MALTGLDLPSAAAIREDILDLNLRSSIIMERRRDLEDKLDFDLNEAPLLDLNADCSGSSCKEPPPHDLINTSRPKKGGWLELFHHMFGHNSSQTSAHPLLSPIPNSDVNQGLLQMPSRGIPMHNHHPRGYHENGIWNNDRFSVLPQQNENEKQKSPLLAAADRSSVRRSRRNVVRGPFLPFADHVSQFLQSASMDRLPFFSSPVHSCSVSSSGHLDPYLQVLQKDGCNRGPGSSYPSSAEQDHAHSISKAGPNSCSDREKAPLHFDLNTQPDMEPDPRGPSNDGFFCPSMAKRLPASDPQNHASKIASYAAERKNYYKGMFAQALDGAESNNDILNRQEILRIVASRNSEPSRDLVRQENGGSPPNSGKASNLDVPNDLPPYSGNIRKALKPIGKVVSHPDWLPPGWITELKTRKAGSTAGTVDKYYKDPVTGRRFRSKNEVLSFLQTGRRRKSKSAIRFLRDAVPGTTAITAILPQDFESKPPASILSRVTDAEAVGQTTGSCSSSLEGISIKEEPDILQIDGTGAATGLLEACRFHMRSGLGLSIPDIQRSRSVSSQEDAVLQTNKESERQNKRLKMSHGIHGLLMQQISVEAKRFQSPNDSVSESLPEACEQKTLSVKDDNTLLCGEEQTKAQSQVVAPATSARYSADGTVPSLCEKNIISSTSLTEGLRGKEFCPKFLSTNRVHQSKITKLTLKQERELFISLGRKLCRQFLASANERPLL